MKPVLCAALITFASFPNCFAQEQKDYLKAVLPPGLVGIAAVEVPSRDNLRMLTDAQGGFLEFKLIPGQAKKNNGIRSEITVNYPYKAGDVIRYEWKMRLPQDFKEDAQNRWWIMGQWHDQPDRTKAETWEGFPANSPPVSFHYLKRDGQDFLSLSVGSPRMKSAGLIPIKRERWHTLDVVIKWSQGGDGKVAVYLDDAKEPAVTGTGPNMHNGYHHYLKLGMYRHPQIATENRLAIRDVTIQKLDQWPGL